MFFHLLSQCWLLGRDLNIVSVNPEDKVPLIILKKCIEMSSVPHYWYWSYWYHQSSSSCRYCHHSLLSFVIFLSPMFSIWKQKINQNRHTCTSCLCSTLVLILPLLGKKATWKSHHRYKKSSQILHDSVYWMTGNRAGVVFHNRNRKKRRQRNRKENRERRAPSLQR